MKDTYEPLQMEVTIFEAEDIITTSGDLLADDPTAGQTMK